MCHACEHVACKAEQLANEIERGTLVDRGGSDALRLLAAVVRVVDRGPLDS